MTRIRVTPKFGMVERLLIRPRLKIDRAKLTYLESRGWTKEGDTYRGLFRTKHGDWWGEAQLRDGELNFFIFNPPQQVLGDPHGQCFMHIGSNWWVVHFWRESGKPSDGVMEIERVLEEAFQS